MDGHTQTIGALPWAIPQIKSEGDQMCSSLARRDGQERAEANADDQTGFAEFPAAYASPTYEHAKKRAAVVEYLIMFFVNTKNTYHVNLNQTKAVPMKATCTSCDTVFNPQLQSGLCPHPALNTLEEIKTRDQHTPTERALLDRIEEMESGGKTQLNISGGDNAGS